VVQVAFCSQTNTKHKYSVGRAYSCRMLKTGGASRNKLALKG